MIISHKSPTAPAKINEQRVKDIQAGFSYDGVVFQTDPLSIDLMKGQVLEILANRALGLPEPLIKWRAADDTMWSFTFDEYLSFYVDFSAFVRGRMVQSWAEKAAL